MSSDSVNHKTTADKAFTINMQPARRSTKDIPHSLGFQDPYALIGDCYERISVAEEWEIPDP